MTSESIFRGHHFYYTEELYILNPYFFTHLLAQDDNIHKHLLILVIKHNNLTHTFTQKINRTTMTTYGSSFSKSAGYF